MSELEENLRAAVLFLFILSGALFIIIVHQHKLVSGKNEIIDLQKTLVAKHELKYANMLKGLENGRVWIDKETEYKCEPTEMTLIYRVIKEDQHLNVLRSAFGSVLELRGKK